MMRTAYSAYLQSVLTYGIWGGPQDPRGSLFCERKLLKCYVNWKWENNVGRNSETNMFLRFLLHISWSVWIIYTQKKNYYYSTEEFSNNCSEFWMKLKSLLVTLRSNAILVYYLLNIFDRLCNFWWQ